MSNFDNIIGGFMSGDNQSFEPRYNRAQNNNRIVKERKRVYNNAGGDDDAVSDAIGNSSGNNGQNNRQLENMSDAALNNLMTEYKKGLGFVKSEEEKNTLQSRIDTIVSEFGKRRGSAKVIGNVHSAEGQEKIKGISSSVGTASLIFGIIGFMGSSFMGSKHPFMWGFAGAGSGAVAVYFLSQDGQYKLVSPVQEVKTKK